MSINNRLKTEFGKDLALLVLSDLRVPHDAKVIHFEGDYVPPEYRVQFEIEVPETGLRVVWRATLKPKQYAGKRGRMVAAYLPETNSLYVSYLWIPS